jgi:hypothetical protein
MLATFRFIDGRGENREPILGVVHDQAEPRCRPLAGAVQPESCRPAYLGDQLQGLLVCHPQLLEHPEGLTDKPQRVGQGRVLPFVGCGSHDMGA